MKSRKQKAALYEEHYKDIPRDYMERLQWMYDKYKLNITKATDILQTRNQMLNDIRFEQEFFIVLYEEPEGSPRPRARYINKSNIVSNAKSYPGYIQVYSLTGRSDNQFMKQLITDNELAYFQSYLIYTACFVDYDVFLKTPSNYNAKDTYLSEIGMIRPITKPDFDNIEKKYADMYNGNIWLDDSLVVEGKIRKYYSILPRVEITLHHLNMLYNKAQYQYMKKKTGIDVAYFETRKE